MTALIFDLDGVIADTNEWHYRSWQRLADEEGLAFDREANDALLGLTREDSLNVLLRGRALDTATRRDWLARKQAYFTEALAQMSPRDILPGITDLLDEADRRGVPCALASSSRNARSVLARLALTDRFAVIADGESVDRPKPAPDIFLHVARELGKAPAACVVIEDSAAGIAAASAGGFPVVSVGPEPRAPLHYPTLVDVGLDQILSARPIMADARIATRLN